MDGNLFSTGHCDDALFMEHYESQMPSGTYFTGRSPGYWPLHYGIRRALGALVDPFERWRML